MKVSYQKPSSIQFQFNDEGLQHTNVLIYFPLFNCAHLLQI